jgi:hypothetical protein
MSLALTRSAFRGNGQALWSGQLQLVNPSGLSIVAATQAGISFGNTTDNSPVNFVGHGTVSSNGPLVLSPTSVATALTINGATATTVLQIVSTNGTTGATDIAVSRNGSTANSLSVGPSVNLVDSNTGTATLWQQSGGQTELWQRSATAWAQVLFVGANRNVVINPPIAGTGLQVTGVAGGNAAVVQGATTASQSFGLAVSGGTNSSDRALLVQNAVGSVIFQQILGDGSGRLGPTSVLGLSWSASGAMTIASPSGGSTLTLSSSNGQALFINGNGPTSNAVQIQGAATVGQSFGMAILAGTNSADHGFQVTNQAGTISYFFVRGDGVVSGNDGAGNLLELGYKGTPSNIQAGNYTLVASDKGKVIGMSVGNTLTVPSGIFSDGDVIAVRTNAAAGNVTIAQGSGLTIYWANGTGVTAGARTMAAIGIATIAYVGSSAAYISGGTLS